LVGGCHCVREMFETGELSQSLAARGVKTRRRPGLIGRGTPAESEPGCRDALEV